MITVERTITVEKPLKAVVGYLKDFSRAEEWDPGTKSCVREDSGEVRVGSSWANVSEFRGRENQLRYTLVRKEPQRLVFEGRHPKVVTRDDLSFETADGGGTHIRYRASLDFKGLLKLASPVLRKDFQRLADEVEVSLPRALAQL